MLSKILKNAYIKLKQNLKTKVHLPNKNSEKDHYRL